MSAVSGKQYGTAVVDTSLGRKAIDSEGSTVAGVRMDAERA